jgi:anti-anti-sigma factor
LTSNIDVAEEREANALVLIPAGRIDSGNARAFESIVTERIGAGEHRLIVDFSRLDFISSSGLRVLLIAAKTLKIHKGSIALCSMKDHIKEVFQISGFDRIIPIRNTRQDALGIV